MSSVDPDQTTILPESALFKTPYQVVSLGGIDTLSGVGRQFSPFKVGPLFRKGLTCRKANRKLQKLYQMSKVEENLPGVFTPLK